MLNNIPIDRSFLWLLMACTGTLLVLPIIMRLAPRIGAVDDPNQDTRRIHKIAVPRVGGIAVAVVYFAIFYMQGNPFVENFGFLGGAILLFLVGIIDDTRGVKAIYKLLGHILAMTCAVSFSSIYFHTIPIPLLNIPNIHNQLVCEIVTIIIGVGIINAMNLIDGLDGLASGFGMIAIASISILSGLDGNVNLCLKSIDLLGCLFGALAFNSYPARVFLGDTGSMIIGYIITICSVNLVTFIPNSGHPLSVYIPFCLLVIPCSDCIWVMLSRIVRDKNPFRADKTHVHHKILGLGFEHKYAVLLLLSFSMIFCLYTILLRDRSDDVLFLSLVCMVQFAIGGTRFLSHARGYRRIAIKVIRIRRQYFDSISDSHKPWESGIGKQFCIYNNYVLKCSFVALCGLYGLSGIRPTELLGWGAISLLLLLLIVLFIFKNKNHHFIYFALFTSLSYLALCSDLQLQDGISRLPIIASRILLLLSFSSGLLKLFIERRMHELLSTPLDLFVLAGIFIIIILVKQHRTDLYYPPVATSCITIFVILRSCIDHETKNRFEWTTWFYNCFNSSIHILTIYFW